MTTYEEILTQKKIISQIHTLVKHLTCVEKDKYDYDTHNDLVQVCAERVFNGMHSFKEESALFTWMYRTCKNTLINREIYHDRKVRSLNKSCLPLSGTDVDGCWMNSDEYKNDIEDLAILEEVMDKTFKGRYTCTHDVLHKCIEDGNAGAFHGRSGYAKAQQSYKEFRESVINKIHN